MLRNTVIRCALACAGAFFMLGDMVRGARQDEDGESRVALLCVQYEPGDGGVSPEELAESLCLASSAGGWRPDDRRYALTPEELPAGFVAAFRAPWDAISRPDFVFKFTRGSWETVEVDATGADIPNRSLSADQVRAALLALREGRVPRLQFRIAGFADERAGRLPERPAPVSTVTGDLRVLTMNSAILGGARTLRVWLPPGYDDPANAGRRYPTLYMNDGQNLFDAATSFAGEWGVDETATRLIQQGRIPALIVVGIDNGGAARGDEYLPRDAGSRYPGMGGGADRYLRMISEEVMPLINRSFRTLASAEQTAFGGSSLGGIVTLHAAMTCPELFGAILVESPSLWVEDGAFLERVKACTRWPRRVFVAQGDREYEGPASEELVRRTRELEQALRAAGLGPDRLRVVIAEGATHNEAAWAQRLPEAMEFLFREAR